MVGTKLCSKPNLHNAVNASLLFFMARKRSMEVSAVVVLFFKKKHHAKFVCNKTSVKSDDLQR